MKRIEQDSPSPETGPANAMFAGVSSAVGAAMAAATVSAVKRGRPKGSPGRPKPKLETLSPQARNHGVLILEVLAGIRSTSQAAEAMGVSSVRYYAIEARAVHALIAACAPRPAGPAPEAIGARDVERLRADKTRLEQEAARLRAVLRSTQRGIGLPPVTEPKAKPPTVAGKKTRRARRPAIRALTTVRRLLKAVGSTTAAVDATSSSVPAGG